MDNCCRALGTVVVGPGWEPLNPAGNFNPQVFVTPANGDELKLANQGMETVHHVHADDVAQSFMQAMANWNNAVGENFHVVAPSAVTLRGYAETAASWFGQSARLRFLPWDQWRSTVSEQEAAATWDHVAHSPNCSMAKAQRLLEYRPRYTSFQAIYESVMWLIDHHVITV